MKKILDNSELKNKTLREDRPDLSPFKKTAIHMFHEEGEDKWLQWYGILTAEEKAQVCEMFNIDKGFIVRQREKNNIVMKIIPINFADFDLVEVKTTNECEPTPHCKNHGAMNKMNVLEDGGGYWRCITVSGYKKVQIGNSISEQHVETICRAGCCEIRAGA